MLMIAPPDCAYSAPKKFVCILNSWTASTDGLSLQVRGAGVLLGGVDQRAVYQDIRRGVARAIGDEVGVVGADGSVGAYHAGTSDSAG